MRNVDQPVKRNEKWKLAHDYLDRNMAYTPVCKKLIFWNTRIICMKIQCRVRKLRCTNRSTGTTNRFTKESQNPRMYKSVKRRNAKWRERNEMRAKMKRDGSAHRCHFDRIVKINEHVPAPWKCRVLLFFSCTERRVVRRVSHFRGRGIRWRGGKNVASMISRLLIRYFQRYNVCAWHAMLYKQAGRHVCANTSKRWMCTVTENVNSMQRPGTR